MADDGHISYTGPRAGAPLGEEETLGEAILLPGLINAHSHLDLTALRGLGDESSFFNWIRRLVAVKANFLDDDALFASACVGISEGIRAGITTYADTSDNPHPFRAMLRAGVRGVAYQEVFGPDPDRCGDAMSSLRAKVDQLHALENERVRVGLSPHAPYSVSDELYRAVARYAHADQLPMAAHIAESAAEFELVVRGTGPFADMLRQRDISVLSRAESPIRLLALTGILECDPLLIHAIRVDGEDLRLIRELGGSIVHCPVSNSKLGHGVAPVLDAIGEGITVAIGTDSVVSNDRMDLLEEGRLAMLLQRAVGRGSLPAAERVIRMLTIDAARALKLADQVGTLEVGKRADLAAFTLEGMAALPASAPEETLLHSLRGADARFVMVDGRVLLRGGRMEQDFSHERGIVERTAMRVASAIST